MCLAGKGEEDLLMFREQVFTEYLKGQEPMDPRDYMEMEDAPERMHIYWNESDASDKKKSSLKIATFNLEGSIPMIEDHFKDVEEADPADWKDEVAVYDGDVSDGASEDNGFESLERRGMRNLRRKQKMAFK